MKKLFPALAVAALALTACAPAPYEVEQIHEVAPISENAPDERAQWAQSTVSQWLRANGAKEFESLPEPFKYVTSWESPTEGELILRTSGGAYTGADLRGISWNILQGAGSDLTKITAVNESGTSEVTYERP